MLILGLESSAKAASAALCRDGELIAQYSQCSGLTHSRTLLPMVEDLLKNTETKLADVDAVAVARGPGSFTGIRIGVAAVKGPVSYTHLDVYKRQERESVPAGILEKMCWPKAASTPSRTPWATMCLAPLASSSAGWKMSLTVPDSSSFTEESIFAAPSSMAV